MTRVQAAALAKTTGAAYAAYSASCNAEGCALDPADLDAREGLLYEAYETPLQVESLVGIILSVFTEQPS